MAELTFGVLGPVEVRAGGGPPVALPPSVRALLARLALAPGRVVSVDALISALWGEEPPADATNALQIRVSKLRRALVAAGADGTVLVTRAPGYQLAVPAEAVDAYRFEQTLSRARSAASTGSAAAALTAFDEALRLWRGPSLADVGDADWALAEQARMAELRLGALEDRFELLLETGRHTEVVADLERLVADNPLRERLHRLLMLALYRAGRQADSLAVYHALRHRLGEELGIDPVPELQALAEAILRQQVPAQQTERVVPAVELATDSATPSPSSAQAAGAAAPSSTPAAPLTIGRATARAAAPAGRDGLPRRLSTLVGRQDDVARVLRRLGEARLVTLTGPGGVGKTTVALEVARHVDSGLVERVHLIRLSSVEAGGVVPEAVAAQLGLAAGGAGAAPTTAVAEHLARGRALLVVDNCEHVIDDSAALVEELVAACPELTVLATSREALAVPGEIQLAVGPLGVPDVTADLSDVSAAPAVRLFLDRARAVRPEFDLDAETAPVVADICRQLDGMPLAIELAAARVKALPPAEIAARLRDRFALLTSGPRTSEARHRTLRATLDWSYNLLSEGERRLLRRLAVFRGGWSVGAAEDVCGFAGLDAGEVLDLLFRLVDRSLVEPDPATGRFRLLVTVREYAWARLEEAGELAACRDRHLDHFLGVAEEYGPRVRSAVARGRLLEEYDNLRAAVDRALERAGDDAEIGFRLTGALVWFWNYGLRYEGVRALNALLEAGGGSTAARARALQGIGLLHVYHPTPSSRAAARESLELFERLGDARNAAISRFVVAWEGQYGGDAAHYRAMVRQAREELGESDDGWWLAWTHYLEAVLELRLGEFDIAARQWRHTLELLERAGDRIVSSAARAHLGIALRGAGRHAEAVAVLHESIDEVRDQASLHGLTFALVHLAHTLLDLGEGSQVASLLAEADEVARRVRNPRCQAWAAWGRGRIALASGRASAAAVESRRALELLEEREFPWARARLWSFMADAAEAAGLADEAERARNAGAALQADRAAG